jgi:hypothetical protein
VSLNLDVERVRIGGHDWDIVYGGNDGEAVVVLGCDVIVNNAYERDVDVGACDVVVRVVWC